MPQETEAFIPYARLAGELIEQATKEQLAEAVQLLALNIGYYHEKYGDVPQEKLAGMVTADIPDEETQRMLLHGMKNLVSALAEAEVVGTQVEAEELH